MGLPCESTPSQIVMGGSATIRARITSSASPTMTATTDHSLSDRSIHAVRALSSRSTQTAMTSGSGAVGSTGRQPIEVQTIRREGPPDVSPLSRTGIQIIVTQIARVTSGRHRAANRSSRPGSEACRLG
ncbi:MULTISPECIES: hypothetical protein [Brevibacterium]|uniref:hypothetical protein n=1 Tax=Brevibacterium TaxID=1696 RepID=UPI000DEAC163|nr:MULTISPECIES: hypothetical protein [Brevibacterium]